LSRDGAKSMCDKAAVLRDKIKGTPHAHVAAVLSCAVVLMLWFVSLTFLKRNALFR